MGGGADSPTDSPTSGAKRQTIDVLGAGCNSIEEMCPLLDDASVQWAIIRFELGGGNFLRQKFIFVHFNGEDTPAVKRGQANAYTAEAQRLLRSNDQEGFHASLVVTRKSEMTLQNIIERVSCYFVKDDIDYTFKLLAQDSGHGIGKRPSRVSISSAAHNDRCVVIPEHHSTQLFDLGRDALHAVADPFGRWNWVLVKPDPKELTLVAGGANSVDEMRECLAAHEEEVLFGLLRMGFGTGRLRRTKHIFVHAVGSKVKVVTRGLHCATRPQMEEAIGKMAHCSMTVEVSSRDLTLENVIDRMRSAAALDDAVLDPDNGRRFSNPFEAFREAEKEDKFQHSTSRTCKPKPLIRPKEKTVEEVLGLLHADEGPLKWALFAPNLAAIRARTMGPVASLPSPPSVAARRRNSSDLLPIAKSVLLR